MYSKAPSVYVSGLLGASLCCGIGENKKGEGSYLNRAHRFHLEKVSSNLNGLALPKLLAWPDWHLRYRQNQIVFLVCDDPRRMNLPQAGQGGVLYPPLISYSSDLSG